jgi:hypothetical protein
MHKALWCGALALSLFGSAAALAQSAPAQEQAQGQQGTPGRTSAPDGTTPPPPQAQPQAPQADQAKPAAVGPAQAATASKLGGPADFATPQTMPSTISAENAKKDKMPTVAWQLPMTDDQKKAIVSSVASAQSQHAANLADIHVTETLPTEVAAQDFSPDLKQKLPDLGRYKFVKVEKRLLIVDPPLRTVVGEITL